MAFRRNQNSTCLRSHNIPLFLSSLIVTPFALRGLEKAGHANDAARYARNANNAGNKGNARTNNDHNEGNVGNTRNARDAT